MTEPAGRRTRKDRDPARRVALDVLLAVTGRDAYANLLLPQLLRRRGLAGRDAALATELAYGTLRGRGTYDAVLAICCDRDLAALDPPVREVLRLGAHQLLGTRIAPHAAVATSVSLVREVAGQRPAGFVNAVLRRVATRDLAAWLEIAAPSRADDPAGHLAVRHSHPRWIVEAFADALGERLAGPLTETEAVLAADNERPLVHLCAVPGLAGQQDLIAAGGQAARWSPFGAYLAEGDPARFPLVETGRAGVQDEASQLAALALVRAGGPAGDGGRWLDVCAGPGGKARLLAGLAGEAGARLTAAEIREHRARLVRAATAATAAAAVVVADGTRPAWRQDRFEQVLADVPCSGLGALRRRPEARWRRSPQDIESLAALQRDLLRTALESARPGGVVAYVTCSPHVAETREVVAAVLAGGPVAEVLDAPAILGEVPDLRCPEPYQRYAQFWPHRHGTDAMFVALLRRR
ncbi:MAG TPA: transcription antitermination factor NusB [Streptosporangiaceae bacterium]|nr:transcription antitermination factor NusB [Streptosporangiaceae bacterium]